MPLLDEITTKKETLFETFLTDRELVNLLTNDTDVPLPAMDLRYKTVFPYAWVGDTVSKADTFLCFEVDVPSVSTIAIKNCYLYVWTFSHESLMRTRQGVRPDLIANRIDELLNGSTKYGFGKLELKSCNRIFPNDDYYGRVLKYHVQDWNRFCCKL